MTKNGVDISGPQHLHWRFPNPNERTLVSHPTLSVDGYELCAVYLPEGKRYELPSCLKPVIITVLDGRLSIPEMYPWDTQPFCRNIHERIHHIEALEDTLLFLCYDHGTAGTMRGTLTGPDLQWKDWRTAGDGKPTISSTDPKIELIGKDFHFRVLLWYLAPDVLGGIHDHKEEPFAEIHTQLRGSGWMVKYRTEDPKSEYERIEMKVGYAHPPFWRVNEGIPAYGMHAYLAGSQGALFAAFERLPQQR